MCIDQMRLTPPPPPPLSVLTFLELLWEKVYVTTITLGRYHVWNYIILIVIYDQPFLSASGIVPISIWCKTWRRSRPQSSLPLYKNWRTEEHQIRTIKSSAVLSSHNYFQAKLNSYDFMSFSWNVWNLYVVLSCILLVYVWLMPCKCANSLLGMSHVWSASLWAS